MRRDKDFHRITGCDGKQKFESFDSANRAVKHQGNRRETPVKLHVYRCQFCDHFHISRAPRRKFKGKH